MPGSPYLNEIVSPCSVSFSRPGGWPGAWPRIAAWVGPPPRPALPPRPWKIVSSIPASRGDLGESLLGPVDRPLRGEVAAVLARVGVADHHLEPVAALGDTRRRTVRRRGAPSRSSPAPFEVGDRLEQRHDRDRLCRSGRARRARRRCCSVAETITVSSACAPCRARACRDRLEHRPRALGRGANLARVQAHVELREVEAEELDRPLERGQRARGDPCASVAPRGCAGSPPGRRAARPAVR